jgi:hypothetical protein
MDVRQVRKKPLSNYDGRAFPPSDEAASGCGRTFLGNLSVCSYLGHESAFTISQIFWQPHTSWLHMNRAKIATFEMTHSIDGSS